MGSGGTDKHVLLAVLKWREHQFAAANFIGSKNARLLCLVDED